MVDVSSVQLLKFDRKLTGTQWCSRLSTKNLHCHPGLRFPLLYSESLSKRLENYVKIRKVFGVPYLVMFRLQFPRYCTISTHGVSLLLPVIKLSIDFLNSEIARQSKIKFI